MCLTREKPFEWTPDDGSPKTISPGIMESNLGNTDERSVIPTTNPAKSYSPTL